MGEKKRCDIETSDRPLGGWWVRLRWGRIALLALLLSAALALGLAWRYQDLPMAECAWCHRTTRLNRHHILQQAIRPDLRDVETNLIVLCRDCHFVLGHRCNWKRCNPDVAVICATFTNSLEAGDE